MPRFVPIQYCILFLMTVCIHVITLPFQAESQTQSIKADIQPHQFFNQLSSVMQSGIESEQIEKFMLYGLQDNPIVGDIFQSRVMPILEKNCLACHSESVQKSNLRLDSIGKIITGGDFGPAVVPGDAKNSLLIEAVQYEHDLKMPPQKKLDEKDIGTLIQWVNDKPYWEKTNAVSASSLFDTIPWSFQKMQIPALPTVNEKDWISNPVDQFVLSKLEANGLTHSQEADKRTLLRRVKLTLHGLPPSLEEQQAFLQDDSPNAYANLVDRLLDSPRYGERWGQHWLDVTGFGETHGFEVNTPRTNAWRYRDYVIESFNQDKPYDQFILEQIAGDAFHQDVATGLLVASPVLLPGQVGKDLPSILQARQDELNGIINVVSSSFLGITVTCARCHNHKFDPVTQKDYYAIQAVFAGVKHGDRISKPSDYDERMEVVNHLRSIVSSTDQQIENTMHHANPHTLLLDEQGTDTSAIHPAYVSYHTKPDRVIEIKEGTNKGERFDYGDINRLPGLSESATVWEETVNTNLMTYAPKLSGAYSIWISWLCGIPELTDDAQYLLDYDGSLDTTEDQTILSSINQNLFADQTNPNQDEEPLWSGFYPVGEHELQPNSVILLRTGNNQSIVSADLIALQQSGNSFSHPIIRPSLNTHTNVEKIKPTQAKYIRFSTFKSMTDIEPCIDEIEIFSADSPNENIALAANGSKVKASESWDTDLHKIEHINDGKKGNSHSWIPKQQQGWIQIELPQIRRVNKIVWGRDQTNELHDRLPVQYKIEVSLDEENWVTIVSSTDRFPYRTEHHMSEIKSVVGRDVDEKQYLSWFTKKEAAYRKIQELTNFPVVYAGEFEKPHEVFRLYRGDPMQKREAVKPDALQVLGGINNLANEAADQERRLSFAQWVASKENPLTARVIVNRLWHYHFGEGIVNTPSDFGANGGIPSNPELLDWLASELIKHNWSLKEVHRIILNSNTFKQDSAPNSFAMKMDSQNRLLWRFSPRRLEAESIRDTILAVSGKLNLKMGGPGFSVFKDNDNYVRVYDPKEEWGPEEFRRMVYATKIRMERDATFGSFDCPDLGQTAPKRSRSTTPLQALNLMNSEFIHQQAEFLTARLQSEAPNDIKKQVQIVYQLAYGRLPVDEEAEKVILFIQENGMQAFCRTLFNTNELLFIQ